MFVKLKKAIHSKTKPNVKAKVRAKTKKGAEAPFLNILKN